MVPDQEDPVELSTILRNEMARQTPGGGLRSPAPAQSRWQRLRESIWSPVLFKVAGACLGLSSLALVGAASMREVPGVAITAAGTDWLAGEADHGQESEPVLPPALAVSTTNEASASAVPVGSATGTGESKATASEANDPGAATPCAAEEAAAPAPQGITADGKVVLNRATAAELTRLPGVGQRRAEQIVALRERLGRFKRITDLLRVKGIGPKSLRRLEPLVVLDPPQPEPDS